MRQIFTLLYACLAVAAWTGCTKEMTSDPVGQGGRLTFQANTPTSEGSRAGYDGVHAIWHAGDEVVLTIAARSGFMFCTQVEGSLSEDGRSVAYTTPLHEPLQNGDIAVAAYLAYAVSSFTEWDNVAVDFEAVQHYVERGYAGMPLFSKTMVSDDNLSFEFKNPFAVIELSLAKEASLSETVKVKSIEFRGANNEPVAGQMDVNLVDFPTMTTKFPYASALKVLTLDCGAGVELTTKPTTFHIVIPVQEYAQGYHFDVITDAGNVPLSAKKSRVTPVANTIYQIPLRTVAASDLNQVIPDAQFRQFLLENGLITVLNEVTGELGITAAGEAATKIDCSNQSIRSLVGIEYFTALTELYCNQNQLTTLDVSKNTALTTLYCGVNSLTTLDVSKNTALTSLNCVFNRLTTLDVSKNTALTTLYCYLNQLTTLDASTMTNDTEFKLFCGTQQNIGAEVAMQLTLREAQRTRWVNMSSFGGAEEYNVGVAVTFIP